MLTRISVLAAYFVILLSIGFLARRRLKDSPGEYFLAGRSLSVFVLVGTMAATNFSAFTVFGTSGAGYRDGLAFFPIMAFGTGFMALTFWLLGRRIWRLGRARGLITPAELIGSLYNHRGLSALFALGMVVFTIPYLALQPLAAGLVLNSLFGLPQAAGAGLITLIIVLYTVRGGFRAVAWTDVFQGLLMVTLMVVALLLVASHFGGLTQATKEALQLHPELFSRPGGAGFYTPAIWFSYLMLWFFCDPMFPQLFQRFYTARSERVLGRTMLLYPAICTLAFFPPVALGVLGRLNFPGLADKAADNIVPLLMTTIAGDFMGTLILTAGLAALMSTMDSQLLTLSSIFARDLHPLISRKPDTTGRTGRFFVLGLAIVGFALAINPPATILQIATQAFTGLAVLFPTVFFGLYLKTPRPTAALASIITGEALVIAYALHLLPTFGFLPAVPAIAGAILAYVLALPLHRLRYSPCLQRRPAICLTGFGLLFLAAQDFWRWGETGPLILGWPTWAWYFVVLSAAQTALMVYWLQTPEPVAGTLDGTRTVTN
ncbi:MAG: sodium:solute symporter family protein [Dehalococcoidia bacterium]|nr:sodium:solute symporter family protein [Dehalococcoidia bacterium]